MTEKHSLMDQIKMTITLSKKILRLVWNMDPRLTLQMFFHEIIAFGLPLLVAFAAKVLIDELVSTTETIRAVTTALVAVFIFKYGCEGLDRIVQEVWWKHYLDYVFRYRFQNYLSAEFYRKLNGLDIPHFETPEVLNMIGKAQGSMDWYPLSYVRDLFSVLGAAILFVISLVISGSFGWYIPFLIVAVVVVRFYFKIKFGNIQWAIYDAGAEENRQLWYLRNLLSETEAQKELRIFRVQETILGKFKNIQANFLRRNIAAVKRYSGVLLFAFLLETIAIGLLAYFRLDDVARGIMSIGTFTFFIATLERLSFATASVSSIWGDLQVNGQYTQYYFDVMDLPVLVPKPSWPVKISIPIPPKIELRGVDFVYPNGAQVLSHFSLTIAPGEHIAIVGENGVGKSTLIKLLCRFYDVTKGEILINGIDIRELDLESWYQCLGTLFQDFNKYNFTVAKNITLGERGVVNEARMRTSAERSGVAKFIEEFPSRYEQMLGRQFSDGQELSQGQWQKVALARAFYHDAPILVLDEPTSAIDAKSEYEIFSSLEKSSHGKTLILVSHRFSTVRSADRIIVIEKGSIIENGSHEDLMKQNGMYARMFSLQAEGYK